MYAVIGVTGKVGGIVARALLADGKKVRAVVRDAEKGKLWAELGCEVAVSSIDDPTALTAAFRETDGVFLMTPPNYDPEPGFPETPLICAVIEKAIQSAGPGKIVFLSTIGAHVSEPNLLNNSKIIEEMLRTLPVPVGLLRAAWFMENASWDVDAAKSGIIPSFLQPLDHKIPMISTIDIGKIAASLLQEHWSGVRIVELEAAERYSADDIAAAFSSALGHEVSMQTVPRGSWEALFVSQGMKHPMSRIRMLDGFNEGWIDFEGGAAERRIGKVGLDAVLKQLVNI